MPLVDFFKEIPGLSEAVKRENDLRDAAFLDLETDICGVKIRQMTAEDLMILDGVDNAIVQGRMPTAQEIGFFLWQLAAKGEKRFGLSWFTRRVRRLAFGPVALACDSYVAKTFQDAPGGSGARRRAIVSWLAALIDRLASQYGWSEEYILKLPLRRAFQYQKIISYRTDPDFLPHNPSDSMIGAYLQRRNGELKAN